jgi:hypothetical protein
LTQQEVPTPMCSSSQERQGQGLRHRNLAQAFDLNYDQLVLAMARFRTSTARPASKNMP